MSEAGGHGGKARRARRRAIECVRQTALRLTNQVMEDE